MIKLFSSSYVGDIVEFCQGVLVSGRYRHGKPRKPVNPPLSINGKEKKDCLRSPFMWMICFSRSGLLPK